MKIRVFESDGVFRGGLLKTEILSRCRSWNGPPHPDYAETLVDLSGYGEPSSDRSWYLIQLSKHPELSEAHHPSDQFDAASQVIRLTPIEALRWFQNSVYSAPPELIELARNYKGRSDRDDTEAERPRAHRALTPAQEKIWDASKGRTLLAKEIAMLCYGNAKQAGAVRKHIESIRRTGRTIDHKRGVGFFRPDAPAIEGDCQRECA